MDKEEPKVTLESLIKDALKDNDKKQQPIPFITSKENKERLWELLKEKIKKPNNNG